MTIVIYDKDRIERFKKLFPEFKDDPRLENYEWFTKVRKQDKVVAEHSFEESYWNGFIILADAAHLVEGWFQSELVEQYRSEPPEYPEFVKITKRER